MDAIYNEIDPFPAQTLRELIREGHIQPGDVDERSIEDIAPIDLRRYRTVHLFAGFGVWSYALRLAGWPDERPVWTCSCPCQPFSQAGKGAGFGDERHLWPAAFHLIRECGPLVCFGEQVASDDGFAWLDLVQNDLEGAGYTIGACVTPAAGYGAPHARHRIYWSARALARGGRAPGRAQHGPQLREQPDLVGSSGIARGVEHAASDGREQRGTGLNGDTDGGRGEGAGPVANDPGAGRTRRRGQRKGKRRADEPERLRAAGVALALGDTSSDGFQGLGTAGTAPRATVGASPVGGFWADAEWLYCTDERYRPIEPGTFPLAHGAPARVGRLRGYGNALVATQAAAWIKTFLEEEAEG